MQGLQTDLDRLTGTAVAGVHRPDLSLEAINDMFGDALLSCRKLASKLGVSRDTVWRCRVPRPKFSKGSWKRTRPSSARAARAAGKGCGIADSPTFIRSRRATAGATTAARVRRRPIVRNFLKPLLGIADRAGRTNLTYIPDTRQPTIAAALLPHVGRMPCCSPTARRNTKAIATAAGMGYWMLVGGRRSRLTPTT